MKGSFVTFALAAGLNSAAIQLFRDSASPAVVTLSTHRKVVPDPIQRDALRRRQTVTETLDNGVSTNSRMHAVSESGSLRR